MSHGKYLVDVITSFEIEGIMKKIVPLTYEKYCDSDSMKMYCLFEKLNMQSHKNSLLSSDDFVMNAFVDENRVEELIKNLFVVEFFKLKIYPNLKNSLSDSKFSLKTYLCLHFESIIINLLEKFFYNISGCLAAGNYLLDIIEYCYYNLTSNISNLDLLKKLNIDTQKIDKNSTDKIDYGKDLDEKYNGIQFSISMACLSITRFISDHLDQLPFPITNTLLNGKDFPLLFVEILEVKPWYVINSSKDITHIYEDNKFVSLEKDPKLINTMNKYEGQIWITLYNLLIMQGLKYEITDYRKNILLRLKKFMNQRLYDQLPPLVNLYRALEQMSISNTQTNTFSSTKSFLVEMVPELFEFNHSNKSDKSLNLKALSETIFEKYFKNADIKDEISMVGEVFSLDNMDYFMDKPICGNCGKEANNRCKQCKMEWYCSKECQILRWTNGHKEFCKKMKDINSN